MPILHKNLNNPSDIHPPKWFDDANNGDYAWRNELGVLESTDELVLPAALDFVNASVAPPTTNTGDIYVLSSGASVNAGWGSVALKDWVRYDGSAWNEITPQKSSLCYNEADDELNSFDGTDWNSVGSGGGGGGDNISNANLTWTGDTIQDLNGNNLTFENGVFNIQGAGTSTGTTLALYDNDTTPNKTWEFLDSGDVNLGQPTSINTNNNNLNFEGGGLTKISNGSRYVGVPSWNTHTYFDINNGSNSAQFLMANASTAFNQDEFGLSVAGFQAFRVQGNTIALGGGFNKNSFNSSYGVNIGNSGLYSGGDIVAADGNNEISFDFANYPKLKLTTSSNQWWLVEGNGFGSTFAAGNLYFYDATNGNRMLEFKAGGVMNIRNGLEVNGTAGFTGTGAYTNFTIENGIITAAS